MSEKITFQDIIEAVCKRPKMYTPTGSFFEVVSLLDGHGARMRINDYHCFFTPFLKWAARRFANSDSCPLDWNDYYPLDWKEYLAYFSSESDATKQFPIFFNEYVKETKV